MRTFPTFEQCVTTSANAALPDIGRFTNAALRLLRSGHLCWRIGAVFFAIFEMDKQLRLILTGRNEY